MALSTKNAGALTGTGNTSKGENMSSVVKLIALKSCIAAPGKPVVVDEVFELPDTFAKKALALRIAKEAPADAKIGKPKATAK